MGIGPRASSAESGVPTQVLHDQVELAVLGLADVVDVDDVRVIDAVRRARLAQHPRAQVRLAAEIRPDQLERDDAIDEDVARPVHDPHPALPEAGFEAVTTGDDLPDHRVDGLLARH